MIGIFDSGVGGMTVAKAIEEALPDLRLIYFGDLAHSPYGSKSRETICRYSRYNTDFLIRNGAKLIVIACNSAASVATKDIIDNYPLPVFEVISPAVRLAAATTSQHRIGVIGTRATISSAVYNREIEKILPGSNVYSQACPLLVPLVEEGWINKRETKMILRRYLDPLKRQQVDTLVLGCTHYPLLKHLIQPRIGMQVKVIDSSQAVAEELRLFLSQRPELKNTLQKDGENLYYVSDITPSSQKTADFIFNRKINLLKCEEQLGV
ncbi:MAG: glutamate racemase [Deltaproteobacteria bacterium]